MRTFIRSSTGSRKNVWAAAKAPSIVAIGTPWSTSSNAPQVPSAALRSPATVSSPWVAPRVIGSRLTVGMPMVSALAYWWSMIFSENRYPLFGIMLLAAASARSGCTHETELLEGGHAVVQTDLLCDLAVLDPKNRHSGEPHLAARCRRQRSGKEVAERRSCVRAAAVPTADDVIAF